MRVRGGAPSQYPAALACRDWTRRPPAAASLPGRPGGWARHLPPARCEPAPRQTCRPGCLPPGRAFEFQRRPFLPPSHLLAGRTSVFLQQRCFSPPLFHTPKGPSALFASCRWINSPCTQQHAFLPLWMGLGQRCGRRGGGEELNDSGSQKELLTLCGTACIPASLEVGAAAGERDRKAGGGWRMLQIPIEWPPEIPCPTAFALIHLIEDGPVCPPGSSPPCLDLPSRQFFRACLLPGICCASNHLPDPRLPLRPANRICLLYIQGM